MIKDTRPTVADLLAGKGKRRLAELNIETVEEMAAADEAGIDIATVRETRWTAEMRAAGPRVFAVAALVRTANVTAEDNLRAAFRAIALGADAVYCAASLATIAAMRAEGIPVVGHVGLVPSRRTWTGGYRAVGKTADSALAVLRETLALEQAGAFAVEMEVVPARVAAHIAKRTRMLVLSMGAGLDADAQYLFARDVLGYNDGHYPRHSKRYRDFRAEYARLQRERVAAFAEFAADVRGGAYPEPKHDVSIADSEFDAFLRAAGAP
jgi:3-methyl-2-oxobutanoate hydroxymethyltransferase